ncbi:MAG TPA: M48 family metallopeptidase [Phycisphaerae bacterium]|nr:M48 family metallopeptidase [Phycisphaerae bacterium]HRY69261.1 M48 family metallopeptidase [Phycisphaerae bacterium]HSA26579.1 M48 family metallopeptidase [Phycisphaerae bacterium]
MDVPTAPSVTNEPRPCQPYVPKQRPPEEVKAYHKIKRTCHLVDIGLSLIYWGLWLALASPFVAWLDGWIDARWPALIVAALVMFGGKILFLLPLSYYDGFLLERRYDLTNQTPRSWLVFEIKGWLVQFVIGGILVAGLFALLWYSGRLWGLWVWIGIMLFSIGLAKVFPLVILPIFYPSKPLERPALAERLKALAGQAGMTLTGIFNLGLSAETKKANAMLAGLGSTRRVYLSDTLLDAFQDDQIAVVFAHELGHHIRKHIFKSIGLAALVTSGLVVLIRWRLDPFAGGPPDGWAGSIAGLAEVGMLLCLYPLAVGPITYAISRHFERQADADALHMTDDPGAFRKAFELLRDMNLADPNPPRWEEIMFDDHPAMAKRIAIADEYAREKSRRRQDHDHETPLGGHDGPHSACGAGAGLPSRGEPEWPHRTEPGGAGEDR